MRLLLDSHIFLWYTASQSPLRGDVVSTLKQADEIYVSVASLWELNLKAAKGKLVLCEPLVHLVALYELSLLSIHSEHADTILKMPQHHGDPFDHMLLAQAKTENLTLMTHDKMLARYDVPILLV